MNKLILASAFAMAGTAAFAVPAFAQQPAETAQPVAAAQPVANAQPATQVHSVPRVDSRHCIRDTGSHIPSKGKCLPVIGTSYSQQDLQRTGATNIGQALQMLDPSITVH